MPPISHPHDVAARPASARVWRGPHIDVAGDTRRGRGSTTNEDAFITVDFRRHAVLGDSSIALEPGTTREDDTQCRLLAVADGRGGRGGQVASWAATDQLARYLAVRMPWPARADDDIIVDLGCHLEKAFAACQERVRATAASELAEPMTSLTAVLMLWPAAVLAHAGSCRAYLYRDHRLRRLTRDGQPSLHVVGGDAVHAPHAIGGGPALEIELSHLSLEPGDQLLLCSDGLWRDATDYQLARALHHGGSASDTVRRLLDRRPDDDATAVVASVSSRARVTH